MGKPETMIKPEAMSKPDTRIYFDPSTTDAKTASGTGANKAKDFFGKVATLVPAEILVGYRAALGFVPAIEPKSWQRWVAYGIFALGIAGTAWYVGWRVGKGFDARRHQLVYILAFIVWAYAISGTLLFPAPYYQDAIAGIILVVASVGFARIPLPAKVRKRR